MELVIGTHKEPISTTLENTTSASNTRKIVMNDRVIERDGDGETVQVWG